MLRTKAGESPGATALGPEAQAPPPPLAGSVLRMLGSVCLVAALLVAGYLGWLLWGTGIGTAREQNHLRQQINTLIAHPRRVPSQSSRPVSPIPEGAPVGILKIPRLHLDIVVVNGTSAADLRRGPGHYLDSPYPWEDAGRVAIAGHRTTYLRPFWSLDKLRPGDLIRLVTQYGTFDYHVTGSRAISPAATWVLKQTRAPTLVLTTCTPRFSATHRLVVFASR